MSDGGEETNFVQGIFLLLGVAIHHAHLLHGIAAAECILGQHTNRASWISRSPLLVGESLHVPDCAHAALAEHPLLLEILETCRHCVRWSFLLFIILEFWIE